MKSPARKSTPQKAADAYTKAQKDATMLLGLIQTRLSRHNEAARKPQPKSLNGGGPHWGHVGDINHLNALLCEIAGYIDPDEADCDKAREDLLEEIGQR